MTYASIPRPPLQTELIRATANTRRGRTATEQQQAAILEAASALEALNPTDSPGSSPLLNGRWSLLFQGTTDWECTDVWCTLLMPQELRHTPTSWGRP